MFLIVLLECLSTNLENLNAHISYNNAFTVFNFDILRNIIFKVIVIILFPIHHFYI